MHRHAAITQLGQLFQDVRESNSPDARHRLLTATREATDVLRAAGWPVEAIIVQLRGMAIAVGYKQRPGLADYEGHEAIVAQCVSTCIHHYYREGDGALSPAGH